MGTLMPEGQLCFWNFSFPHRKRSIYFGRVQETWRNSPCSERLQHQQIICWHSARKEKTDRVLFLKHGWDTYGGEYWTKIYIKPCHALYRTMWWHTQQNNKLLGGQIYHTRYIVLLYRTCPYIVPYAAISSLVLPNCHQCAAIECKSSHKIVPCAAISYSMKLYFKRSAMLP